MSILDFKIDRFDIQIFGSMKSIDSATWDTLQTQMPFYQSYAFLSTMEGLQQDIQHRYVLVMDDNKAIGAFNIQSLHFSFKNLINYSGERNGILRNMLKRYFESKEIQLLNLGNVCFTGDRGIISDNETLITPLLPFVFSQVRNTFEGIKPSASLIANVYLQENNKSFDFLDGGFHPFDTEPDIFMDINPSWLSFEDYTQSLNSKYRIRTKKVQSLSNILTLKELSLEEIAQATPALTALYKNVVEQASFNMTSLNTDFFVSMKRLYQDKSTLLAYYLEDKIVGYAFLFHLDKELLHVHYIGLDYQTNQAHKLYNRMLLDFVKFAIDKRIKHIHFGRTATEIKTTIGAVPKPLRAYLRMDNKLVNALLPYIFKFIKPAPYIARNPFK